MDKLDVIEELNVLDLDEVTGATGQGFVKTTSGDCNDSGASCWTWDGFWDT